MPPILVIAAALTGAVVVQDLASKIAAKLTGVYSSFTIDVQIAADKKVTMIYKQRAALNSEGSKLARQLSQASSTVDQLAQFALQALAQSQLGYISFNAVAAQSWPHEVWSGLARRRSGRGVWGEAPSKQG